MSTNPSNDHELGDVVDAEWEQLPEGASAGTAAVSVSDGRRRQPAALPAAPGDEDIINGADTVLGGDTDSDDGDRDASGAQLRDPSALSRSRLPLSPVGSALVATSTTHPALPIFGTSRDVADDVRQLYVIAGDWCARAPEAGRAVKIGILGVKADHDLWHALAEEHRAKVRKGNTLPVLSQEQTASSRGRRIQQGLFGIGGGLLLGLLGAELLGSVPLLDLLAGPGLVGASGFGGALVGAIPDKLKSLGLKVDYLTFDVLGRYQADLDAQEVAEPDLSMAKLPQTHQAWLKAADARVADLDGAQLVYGQPYVLAFEAEGNDRAQALASTATICKQLATSYEHLSASGRDFQWHPVDPSRPLSGNIAGDNAIWVTSSEVAHAFSPLDEFVRLNGTKVAHLSMADIVPRSLDHVADPWRPGAGMVAFAAARVGTRKRFAALTEKAMAEHVVATGGTGVGKSTILETMVVSAANGLDGPGLVIDPHGEVSDDLATAILCLTDRGPDTLLLDPGNEIYSMGLNPFDVNTPADVERATENIEVLVASELGFDANTPRAEPMVMAAVAAVLDVNRRLSPDNKCNLLHLIEFFTNARFRAIVMARVQNKNAVTYYGADGIFTRADEKDQLSAIGPIVNRLQKLTRHPASARIFASPRNLIDIPAWMADNKIVLMKMARFKSQRRLGEFLVAAVLPGVLNSLESFGIRKDERTHERVGKTSFVILDEAHAVLRPDAKALVDAWTKSHAEARKFGVSLTTATQFLGQLEPAVQRALFVNAKNRLTGSTAASEVATMSKNLAGGGYTADQVAQIISNLDNYVFLANVLHETDGGGLGKTGNFTAHTVRPPDYRALAHDIADQKQELEERSRAAGYNLVKDMDARIERIADVIIEELVTLPVEGTSTVVTSDLAEDEADWGGWDNFEN